MDNDVIDVVKNGSKLKKIGATSGVGVVAVVSLYMMFNSIFGATISNNVKNIDCIKTEHTIMKGKLKTLENVPEKLDNINKDVGELKFNTEKDMKDLKTMIFILGKDNPDLQKWKDLTK